MNRDVLVKEGIPFLILVPFTIYYTLNAIIISQSWSYHWMPKMEINRVECKYLFAILRIWFSLTSVCIGTNTVKSNYFTQFYSISLCLGDTASFHNSWNLFFIPRGDFVGIECGRNFTEVNLRVWHFITAKLWGNRHRSVLWPAPRTTSAYIFYSQKRDGLQTVWGGVRYLQTSVTKSDAYRDPLTVHDRVNL